MDPLGSGQNALTYDITPSKLSPKIAPSSRLFDGGGAYRDTYVFTGADDICKKGADKLIISIR